MKDDMSEGTGKASGRVVVTLPVNLGKWATLDLPAEMTRAQWDQLLVALESMKVGFVQRRKTKRAPLAERPSAAGPCDRASAELCAEDTTRGGSP